MPYGAKVLGKLFCNVYVQFGVVEVGDLFTTSPTGGDAMKAFDPCGVWCSYGKGITPLKGGQGLATICMALK
jgi:hypothetical protein